MLSKRQKEIVDLLMQDLSSKEVAAKLGLKSTHISSYLTIARAKYKVNTTHGLLLKIKQESL